ncbi:hypothetical protein Ciccas_014544, partial [Cichlidogyrus casuarinus]
MLSFLFLSACFLVPAFADGVADEFRSQVEAFPNIVYDGSLCLGNADSDSRQNQTTTYICDPTGLLKQVEMVSEDDSVSPCNPWKPRAKMAVAIVDEMKIPKMHASKIVQYASVFSYHMFKSWNLTDGCKGQSSMIVLFSNKERVVKKLARDTLLEVALESQASFSVSITDGLMQMISIF